jgi:hypothetical protein
MTLVGEANGVDGAVRGVRINEYVTTALNEPVPLEIKRDTLGAAKHVRVERLVFLSLSAYELVERHHGLLDNFNNVGFKLAEVRLYGNEIALVVVLFHNLPVESVVDAPVYNIWIV